MNELIKELAEQAGIVNRKFSFGQWWETDLTTEQKNFAELIVRECAELCTDPYHCGDAGTGDGFGITAADIRCEKLIKQHFGVEE